jgi:dTDP-4-dehydrorhamnose reductase
MLASERTLVLGGSGFLGAHVVRCLALAGRCVVSASREPRAGESIHGVEIETRVLDALRPAATSALIEELEPSSIVLTTALSRASDCDAYPGLARELNVSFPARVAGLAERRGIRLVHVSTDLVFGDREPPPSGFREHDPVGPVSLYGESKAEGEEAVLASSAGALVVRLPLMFGDSGGRGRGASDWILAEIEAGRRPTLFTDEFRTPLAVDVAASALVELADTRFSGRLHVAGPERLSRHELGLAVLRRAGLDPARVRAGTRAESGLDGTRAADVSLDSTRARSLLQTPI